MSRNRQRARYPVLALLALGAVLVVLVVVGMWPVDSRPTPLTGTGTTAGRGDDHPPSGRGNVPTGRPRIEVAVGDVPTLYPGVRVQFPVTLTNLAPFDVLVDRVTVRVEGTAACVKEYVGPSQLHVLASPLRLARRTGAGRIMLPLAMSVEAPDACQGQTFAVHVTAKAAQA